VASTACSTWRAVTGSTRDITTSTRMCSLVRSRCGAAKKVEMNSPYSVSSIRPMIDGNRNIRRTTSALTPTAMAAITTMASTQSARTSQPLSQKISCMREVLSAVVPRMSLGEKWLQLADQVGAELLQVVPVERHRRLLELRPEVDGLDALFRHH